MTTTVSSEFAVPEVSSPLLKLLNERFEPPVLERLLGIPVQRLDTSHLRNALHVPLAAFLSQPGKQFRANLVEAAFHLAGGRGACPGALPAIVELIHAGSLIVDDIQDGSTTRRGQAALHVAHGLPVALNAGNWLYFLAFTLVDELDCTEELRARIFRALSRTMLACHYGQGLDLTARIDSLAQNQVPELVHATTHLKTGALMSFAASLGATVANADETTCEALVSFGARLGVGLQMLDDVGGLVNERRWLKGREDLTTGKPTWPWAWLASELSDYQYLGLKSLAVEVTSGATRPEVLASKMRLALRGSGRVRARRHLHEAFAALRAACGPSETLNAIEAETQRLEKSYG